MTSDFHNTRTDLIIVADVIEYNIWGNSFFTRCGLDDCFAVYTSAKRIGEISQQILEEQSGRSKQEEKINSHSTSARFILYSTYPMTAIITPTSLGC